MNKTTKSSRLQGKDLMNIGIYSAIYCVIVTGVAMLGYIPIMMPMLCALVPLIAGVPFMLFLTKVSAKRAYCSAERYPRKGGGK